MNDTYSWDTEKKLHQWIIHKNYLKDNLSNQQYAITFKNILILDYLKLKTFSYFIFLHKFIIVITCIKIFRFKSYQSHWIYFINFKLYIQTNFSVMLYTTAVVLTCIHEKYYKWIDTNTTWISIINCKLIILILKNKETLKQ